MITQGVQGVYAIGEWMLNKMRNGEPFFFGQIMERMANEYGSPSQGGIYSLPSTLPATVPASPSQTFLLTSRPCESGIYQ